MYALDALPGPGSANVRGPLGRRVIAALGLRPVSPAAIAGGALLGACLGAHVLAAASLTFGYRVSVAPGARLLVWLTYDLCLNVPLTECLLRGVLFDRAYRRWSLPVAAGLSVVASLVRYLVDPRLLRTIEAAVGAIFYIALLSATNCWLVARTGSVLPALASAAAFFAGWRLLTLE